MNITVDIRCLMHPNYSGVGEYAYNLLNNLFKIDRHNQYQLFYNARHNIIGNLPRFNFTNVKFRAFHYPNKIFNLGLKILSYPRLDKLVGQTDVFFAPNLNFLAFSKNCIKAVTIHDLSFEIYPHFFSLKRNLWHKLINPLKIAGLCDKIIAVSQNTKDDLIKYYQIPPEKIKVIYSGVDQNIYKKLEPDHPGFKKIANKYQLPKEFVLFLGTIEPRKNIAGLIKAFDLLKTTQPHLADLHLVIAGERGWNYEEIFQLAEKSEFTKQIIYLDYVSREDKPFLYNLAKLFVFPSYYEGFGLPVLEAQACGVPVIASNISSFPEILGQSGLLINPDNIQEISWAMTELLANQSIRNKLINEGLKNIKRFSWANTAKETLDYLLK